MQFRSARPEDIDPLLGLMRDYYALDGLLFDEATARAALSGLLENPATGRAWLIQVGETPVGYAVLTLGYSLEYQGRDAFVDELYLRADARGDGLGRAALARVEQEAAALGVRALHLEVGRRNTAAQGLYRRAGFRDNERQLLTKRLG